MGETIITLRDEALVEWLLERAKLHNLSLDQEVADVLTSVVGVSRQGFDRLASAQRIAAMTPKGRKQTDSTILIRQHRDGHQ